MTQLMYSPSDTLMTRSQLALVKTPPAMGNSHMPYAFADYVDDVTVGLDRRGFNIEAEEFVTAKNDMQFFGLMKISGDSIDAKRDFTINVGLRGSHDQTLPRGLILGTSVIVCSNLCFHGNIGQFRTKQTTFMASRLKQLIGDALDHITPMVATQDDTFGKYKMVNIGSTDGDAALVSMYRKGGFSSPQLTTAINEWHEPSYKAHAEDGFNIWRLFNASTEALKPGGANVNMAIVEERSRVISDYCTALAA